MEVLSRFAENARTSVKAKLITKNPTLNAIVKISIPLMGLSVPETLVMRKARLKGGSQSGGLFLFL